MDAHERLLQELQEKLRRTEASLSNAQASLTRAESKLDELSSHHSAVTEQFAQTIDEKNHQIALLEQKIKRLLSNVKGSRQERINPDQLLLLSPEELNMLSQELESQAAQEEEEQADASDSEEKKKSKASGRRKLPSNLPREVRRYELSEEQRKCPCCGDTRHEMGVESSEQLEFVPAVFKIIEHQRVQYACKNCQENVAIADKPPQPIEKGVPGPGLCSYVVLSKFGDHLPLYREEDLFNRMGWDLRRSTICQWLGTLGVLVDPLINRMKHLVLQSKVIHTDDTKIKLMDLGTCQEAKFWPYLGDWLQAMRDISSPPSVWVQMSTAHIYGDPPSAVCTEESAEGIGLAPTVARAWEAAFAESKLPYQRGVIMRTSFVVGRDRGAGGGALATLGLIAKLAPCAKTRLHRAR